MREESPFLQVQEKVGRCYADDTYKLETSGQVSLDLSSLAHSLL